MIPGIVATGPSLQKERFFKECAAAFEFLSTFYTLPKDKQEELVNVINIMQVESSMKAKDKYASPLRRDKNG